ncbi:MULTISPECIES: S24 family peptidase [unclassified Mameliella]|uniref:LexA family transcriptional regulator n=1 Tax=unclassified Mameliella TaxID=2630630 RepID=UPI00273D0970|nr:MULTISPECIES: S24 family peptidase [unclassified Mameliella]
MQTDLFVKGLRTIFEADKSLKPATVSTAAGLSNSAIRKMFENPQASPKMVTASSIADVLGLTVDQIIATGRTGDLPTKRSTITIAGKVGAGARVPVFDAYEKGAGPQVEAPPGLPSSGVVAVEIQGDSMEPVFSAGDLLFYSRNSHDGVPVEVIGKRCVCEDENGMGWVKLVRLGRDEGTFDLHSFNDASPTMYGVRLKWAAPVRLHWPADLARKI